VRSFSVHPGVIVTDLSRHLTDDDFKALGVIRSPGGEWIVESGNPLRFKTTAQGAATSIWCATSPQLNGLGGVYCQDCDIAPPISDSDIRSGVYAWATDPEAAERLWSLSEKLTGHSFSI
jgi:hypothetical protein